MSRKKNPLLSLWQDFINQTPPPNELTLQYVMALRAEIDRLEMELALAKKVSHPVNLGFPPFKSREEEE